MDFYRGAERQSVVWVWLNPRIFAEPARFDGWM